MQHEKPFQLVRFGSIKPIAPKWTVKGLLEQDCLTLVFGDPGCGKSFFGIDVGASVATGKDWHGRKVNQCPVIYLAGEGHNGLARRRMAWEARHGRKLESFPFYVSTVAAPLISASTAAKVMEAVDVIATEEGAPGLIVVDTLARNFGPGDENSTQDMTAFIASLDLIRARYQATILLIHHTGHGDKQRARGAMALKGALDAEYRMEKDGSGVIRLVNQKMKDGPEPEPMAFRLRTVELGFDDEDGEPVTSAVLDTTEYEPPRKAGKEGRGKWQSVALDELRRLHTERRTNLASSGHDPDTARVAVHEWRTACLEAGMPKQRWYDLQTALPTQQLVKIERGFAWLA